MGKILIGIIKIYQLVISPDHSWRKIYYPFGFCKFYPSCSQYAIVALRKKSLAKGIFLIFFRIIRCRPGNIGGYDPVN